MPSAHAETPASSTSAPVSRRVRRDVVGGPPVAAAVHRRGQLDRPIQGAFEDRHRGSPQTTASAVAGLAPQPLRRADPARVGDQLRRERQRHHRRDADLVERARARTAAAAAALAKRVGRTDAADDRRQLQPLREAR